MGIPVYDIDGERLIADSVTGACAALQTSERTLREHMELHRDGWRLTSHPARGRRHVPVYAEDGETQIASSIAAAARILGSSESGLRDRLVPHRDGMRVGPKRGQPRWVRIVAPDGRSWPNARRAAADLGCYLTTIWRLAAEEGSRREGRVVYLARLPEYAGQVGGARTGQARGRQPCEVAGCGAPSVARGLCRRCYNRWWMRNAVRGRRSA